MEKIADSLGNKIKQIRSSKGISQEAFANSIGLHRTYMGAVERGEKNITIVTASKIAGGLKISLSELLKGID